MAITIKRVQLDGSVAAVPLSTTPVPLPTNLFTQVSPTEIQKITETLNEKLETVAEFKQTPAVFVHNLFAEALAQGADPGTATTLQPWEIDPAYTILVALSEFAAKKFPKKKLTIVHRVLPTHCYVVKEYDPQSGRAKLEGGFKGGTLKPVITEREAELYYPVWS